MVQEFSCSAFILLTSIKSVATSAPSKQCAQSAPAGAAPTIGPVVYANVRTIGKSPKFRWGAVELPQRYSDALIQAAR